MLLKNCYYFDKDFVRRHGDIAFENGIITALGHLSGDGRDMQGATVLPGFVDIHIHGCGGADFSDGTTDAFDTMSKELATHGVTSFCGTTMTLPEEKLTEILRAANSYTAPKAKLVGINLEGPYISKRRCGAQNKEFIRPADYEEFRRLCAVNKNIKLITVAPDAYKNRQFIFMVSGEVTVALGHTCADENITRSAFYNGAKHITHLFNAMPPLHHRHPGLIGEALANEEITCELICDGRHVHPSVLKATFAALGDDRAVVISDAMRAAGCGWGKFELGGQIVYARGDAAYLEEDGRTLAASVTNLFDEFLLLLENRIPIEQALRACTINPARVIGEEKHIGSIEVGKCADLIVTDHHWDIKEVYINGILA